MLPLKYWNYCYKKHTTKEHLLLYGKFLFTTNFILLLTILDVNVSRNKFWILIKSLPVVYDEWFWSHWTRPDWSHTRDWFQSQSSHTTNFVKTNNMVLLKVEHESWCICKYYLKWPQHTGGLVKFYSDPRDTLL